MVNKILFYNIEPLCPTRGGVHRVTDWLIKSLTARGFICQYMYECGQDFALVDQEGNESIIDKEQIVQAIINRGIEVIIDQQAVTSAGLFEIIKQLKPYGVKYMPVYHQTPNLYDITLTPSFLIRKIKQTVSLSGFIANSLRLLLYPLWKLRVLRGVRVMYGNIYSVCDRCVMLSKGDVLTLENVIGIGNLTKCHVINNPLSFRKIELPSILKKKKKKALIVARLNDTEKRISLALNIWRDIEKCPELADWELGIVGSGPDERLIKKAAYRNGLKNVVFYGSHPSEPFYKDASIYLCTSAVEGWGLMLTEAMQNGVVPIAFDSYAALKEIVTDREDGIIVKEKDVYGYVSALQVLMRNDEMRDNLAVNALNSCSRFNPDKIVSEWLNMLKTL